MSSVHQHDNGVYHNMSIMCLIFVEGGLGYQIHSCSTIYLQQDHWSI